MPGGDRTGPRGMGPMTGRAAGFCAGYPAPGFANPMWGGGFGWGFGRGRGMGGRGGWGRRNWFYATGVPGWQRAYSYPAYGYAGAPGAYFSASYPPPPGGEYSKENELDALKDQAAYMEESLNEIKKRMAELEAEAD